jgi:hypothetical protein
MGDRAVQSFEDVEVWQVARQVVHTRRQTAHGPDPVHSATQAIPPQRPHMLTPISSVLKNDTSLA